MPREQDLNRSIRVRAEDLAESIHPTNMDKSVLNEKNPRISIDKGTNKDYTENSIVYCFQKDADYETDKGYPALADLIVMDVNPNKRETILARDRHEACAIQTRIGEGYKFQVKFDKKSGGLFNPKDMFGTKPVPKRKKDDPPVYQVDAVDKLKWRTINEVGFINYLNFLKTGTESYIIKANRSL